MEPNEEYRDDGKKEKLARIAYRRWRKQLARRMFRHMDKANAKHPQFAVWLSHRDPHAVEGELELVRRQNADTPQGCISWIQREETLEVEQAFYMGDFDAAISEAYDELAVVARKIAWLEAEAKARMVKGGAK